MVSLVRPRRIAPVSLGFLAITAFYRPHHGFHIPTALALANDFADVEDPAKVYEHQIAISAQHRFVSLALREYHCILSQYLSKHGITLPDLESLISEAYQD